MKKIAGVFHRVDGDLGYQLVDGAIIVVLKAPKSQLTNVLVEYDDPYSWTHSDETNKHNWDCAFKEKPFKVESDDIYDYFSFKLKNKEGRYRYFFSFDNDGGRACFGEYGWMEYKEGDMSPYHPYSFSWHNSSIGKVIKPADWWTKTSWYQIFPDRFNSDKKELGTPTGEQEFIAGGNLRGIIEKIDYIKDLGFNGIYLNPIFKATSNHKYDTEDYFEIDEDFGTMEDFKELVSELKKRDMRIMLDGVFNHSGWMHPFWQDILKNGSKSKYADFYEVYDFDKVGTPESFEGTDFYQSGDAKGFETFANTPAMPRFKFSNPELQKYIIDIIEFWTKLGIDAWRMDVGDEVSFDLWRKVKTAANNINKEIVILGEVWYDSKPFLNGDQFDSTMNYPFRVNSHDFFINKTIDCHEFTEKLISTKYKYSQLINRGLFNMIGTHDTARIFDDAKSPSDARMLTAFLILYQGVVSWYYGDEIELAKNNNEWNRQNFDWNFDRNNQTYKLVKELMKFRNENIDSIQNDPSYECVDNGILMTLDNGKTVEFDVKNSKINLDNKIIEM